jgi:hypothetical protein
MLLGSKKHTATATKRWRLDYSRWLENTAEIVDATVASSSVTCSAENTTILGKEVVFFLTGGEVGETFTVSVIITDNLGNIQPDTIVFTVVAP